MSACYKDRVEEALAGASLSPSAAGTARVLCLDDAGLVAELVRRGESGVCLPDEAEAVARSPQGTDGCLLLYTSGTTSKPKGVLHTHASIAAQVKEHSACSRFAMRML